jgi:hypothetical protein
VTIRRTPNDDELDGNAGDDGDGRPNTIMPGDFRYRTSIMLDGHMRYRDRAGPRKDFTS